MTTESTKPLIQIRGLTKSYSQTTALKNVDLDMVPGQIIGLLGPNGSGKTTLIKIMNGLLRDYSGEILIDGHNFLPSGRQLFQRLDESQRRA